ncbi:MAG TPA: hypothetical protein DDW31_01075 [candidate division Zixibacteria bacterium]|nr:hypothetical protein [candidate division Zixibacteria bacterium]
MNNPFQYGGVVLEDSFCNRKKELAEIIRVMENSGRAFLYSERRFGKTSLVRLALRKLDEKKFIAVYADLWPTDGDLSFIEEMAKAVAKSANKPADKALKFAKSIFQRLTPSLTVDEDGKPQVTFGMSRQAQVGPSLEEVLEAPAKMAARERKKVVVILDEIQRVLEYDSDLVERKIRSVIQHHKNVSYIFLGSRKHLVHRMFLDKSRPLYRAAVHLALKDISLHDWTPFIRRRFINTGKVIRQEQIGIVYKLTQGHPFYTQQLCHVIWEMCEPKKVVSADIVKIAMEKVFLRESYAYTLLWESLAKNQKRFLVGLAREQLSVKPFSDKFLRQYQLGSASSAQRVVKTLLERDIIDHENGSFIILDRFLRTWIQKMQI